MVVARLLLVAISVALPCGAMAQHRLDSETWIEMRKMFRETGPKPSIEDDVAALAGPDARRAGPRLIDRGPEVLPRVHAALLDPNVTPKHALRLLQVLGPLSHESSVPVLLEVLARDPTSPLRRDALLVLAMLPATDEAAAFVAGIAASDTEPWRTRRMAFTWYGWHRDPRGRPFARSMLDHPDPEHRAAGLYVLARLGDDSALEPISALLAAGVHRSAQDVLLLALAELTTPQEFERLAASASSRVAIYNDALRYARFRSTAHGEKEALCLEMLRAELPGHLRLAVRCLLEGGSAEKLRPFAAMDLEAPGREVLIRNEIRKAGWRIVDTDTEFRIERGSAP